MRKTVRINIPRKTAKLLVLAYKILAKHLADGASSLLIFLNMADLQTKTDMADASHKLSVLKSKEAEEATESRNNALGIGKNDLSGNVLFYIYLIRDLLLDMYKNNEHALGRWGFEVNDVPGKGITVVIPKQAPEIMQLAADILAKHNADGASSVLSGLNMAELQSKLTIAEQQYDLSKILHQQSEEATQACDLALGHSPEQTTYTPSTVLFYVCSVRDSLLSVYRGSERKLGEWGFNVDSNLPSPPPPEPEITITMATKQSTPTTPVNMGVKGTNGEDVTANYGDSTTETKTVNDTTPTVFSHLHGAAGNYSMQLIAAILAFLEFYAPDCKQIGRASCRERV